MKTSFEDRLVELSSEAVLKVAKLLLKQGCLDGAWHDQNQWLCGRFHHAGIAFDTKVHTGADPICQCSCHSEMLGNGKFCEHTIALIMYGGRFHFPLQASTRAEEATYYGGLRHETLPKLIEHAQIPLASISIEALSTFPHVPSKWENIKLAVKLHAPERDYLGNLNNLRQLYFDKSLSATLRLEHFSLHEQQIIRFLAINGEPENSQILLNAELTAEFFHCLVNYPRFTRAGRRVLVRGESAEPVLLYQRSKSRTSILSPGIRINGALLPVAGARVIAGKAGCWIGHDGEYFFVPATCEISWLRNFFRASSQKIPEGLSVEEFLQNFPLPVLPIDSLEIPTQEVSIWLDGELKTENEFTLRVKYIYEHGSTISLQKTGGGYLVSDGKKFWKCNENTERQFDTELALIGFDLKCDAPTLRGIDHIGTFLDRALPEIMAIHPNLALGTKLASLIRGSTGLPELEFHCKLLKTTTDAYLIRYSLMVATVNVEWELGYQTAKQGRDYAILPGIGIFKISPALATFFQCALHTIRNLSTLEQTFEVPFYTANYFTHLVRDIPGALVPEVISSIPTSTHGIETTPSYGFNGKLREYQSEGVKYMQWMIDRNFNLVLADEMGLGKTVQLLALLARRKLQDSSPALIVCPASLVMNWFQEAHRFVPDFRVLTLSGSKQVELLKSIDSYDLIVLSYTLVRLCLDKLKRFQFSFLVLDEAQHIKNPGSANAKSCKNLKATHRLVLTGTPLENTPDDLWSIMDFLHPGILGTLSAFRKTYSNIHEDPKLQQDLAARVGPFIKRRTKKQVATDLPPKSELTIYCNMSPAQRNLYEKTRSEGLAQLARFKADDNRCNTAIFSTLMRLRQICCHPALLADGSGIEVPSAKMELLFELLHENIDSNHRMLLFSQFTSLLALVSQELNSQQIPFEYLDGSTKNRQKRVDHFNNTPEIPLFLLSLKAGGTGLNLASADTVIIYDPWWNPATELQATDRTHRIGQTRAVSSIKLVVKDSIEEKILDLQRHKQEIFNSVINHPESLGLSLSIHELKSLLG